MTQQPKTQKRPPFILIVLAGFVFICVVGAICSVGMEKLGLVPTSTPSAIPTDTLPPTSTSTPEPTKTPAPTDTPLPTFTPTPPPEPIILTGTGDNVLDINKWEGPALLKVKHSGGGNFAIFNDDANGDHIDLLVNTIGNYQGTLPLDFLDSQQTARFEITAGGSWEIQILPLISSVRRETIPGVIQGTGDEIIAFDGSASPDLLKADASGGSGNFVIFTYGSNGRDLVINEIAPYTGAVSIDRGTSILVITATGQWSIEITTR